MRCLEPRHAAGEGYKQGGKGQGPCLLGSDGPRAGRSTCFQPGSATCCGPSGMARQGSCTQEGRPHSSLVLPLQKRLPGQSLVLGPGISAAAKPGVGSARPCKDGLRGGGRAEAAAGQEEPTQRGRATVPATPSLQTTPSNAGPRGLGPGQGAPQDSPGHPSPAGRGRLAGANVGQGRAALQGTELPQRGRAGAGARGLSLLPAVEGGGIHQKAGGKAPPGPAWCRAAVPSTPQLGGGPAGQLRPKGGIPLTAAYIRPGGHPSSPASPPGLGPAPLTSSGAADAQSEPARSRGRTDHIVRGHREGAALPTRPPAPHEPPGRQSGARLRGALCPCPRRSHRKALRSLLARRGLG